tara:strand:+ start:7131 stop:7817 length:687 start_codon:yes stop_codon:yes gene_type:complete
MSIRDRVAVDGSALQMDQQVSAPKSDPMPGNKVDPNVGQNILKAIAPLASDAEFPLRKTLATPNTTVFTNHFEIKLDPKMQLYEYNIQGLPARVGKRTCRILVREMINAIPFLRANQDMFATDYEKKLISWIEIAPDNLGPVEVKSSERRSLVGIGLELVGMLNTSLLQEYADGKVAPTKVRTNDRRAPVSKLAKSSRGCFSTLIVDRKLNWSSSGWKRRSTWSSPPS